MLKSVLLVLCPPFAYHATCSGVCDVNSNSKNGIAFTDAKSPGGKMWWSA
jgi:hypothetical protein